MGAWIPNVSPQLHPVQNDHLPEWFFLSLPFLTHNILHVLPSNVVSTSSWHAVALVGTRNLGDGGIRDRWAVQSNSYIPNDWVCVSSCKQAWIGVLAQPQPVKTGLESLKLYHLGAASNMCCCFWLAFQNKRSEVRRQDQLYSQIPIVLQRNTFQLHTFSPNCMDQLFENMKARQFANPLEISEQIQLKMSTLSELPTGKYEIQAVRKSTWDFGTNTVENECSEWTSKLGVELNLL